MAEANAISSGSATVTQTTTGQPTSPGVILKLRKPKSDKKVQWQQGTVDNEFMGKKKSKCCCIYEKPKLFGESSDEDDDNDDGCSPQCRGHKKKCYQKDPADQAGASGGEGPSGGSGGSEGGQAQ